MMAQQFARGASLVALLLNVAIVKASMYWTYTSNLADSVSSDLYTYFDGDTSVYTYDYTRTVSSGVKPPATATPYSTSTYERDYESIEIVYAYYTTSVFAESDLVPTDDLSATTTGEETSTWRTFYMNLTYTAPSSCSSHFTYETIESVRIPSEVLDQITPLSTVHSTPTASNTYLDMDTVYVYETWYLSEGAIPISTATEYKYTEYVANCENPDAYNGGDYYNDTRVCSIYGCTSWRWWIIIIASVLPGLFVLGFLESWFWFRRLMIGKACLRFGTVCWVMISLWVLCFTRTQSARSQDDQKLLREKWNEMGSWQAFRLWWKWGLRHAYPVELLGQYSRNTVGIVPAGQPLPQPGEMRMSMGPGYQGVPPPGTYILPNGQPYYPPPQGNFYPQQGYGYPPPSGPVFYGEQNKEAPIVSTSTIPPPPQPSVSPVEGQPPMHNPPSEIGTAQAPTSTRQSTQSPPIEAPTPTTQASPPPVEAPTPVSHNHPPPTANEASSSSPSKPA